MNDEDRRVAVADTLDLNSGGLLTMGLINLRSVSRVT